MLGPAGVLLGLRRRDDEHFAQEPGQGLVVKDDLLGQLLTGWSQGDGAVGLVVDQVLIAQAAQGRSHRTSGHPQTLGDVLGPGHPVELLQLRYGFQIILGMRGQPLTVLLGGITRVHGNSLQFRRNYVETEIITQKV
eukprot:TRINITY_DN4338_c1_g4_i1.p2 TRINITY_DN4338_c1_g4~~TRINITY_DN4338_c1_g4_i1.p2  ORF type:complete len:137 (+),score=34.68 TRINITY_DN4338_c1_g4_i1:715-1125(+)